MSKTRKEISEETRAKLLIWSARHCCFCGKQCTTNIEIHHIDGDPSNNLIDNLIPLCFDCHGELERYNPSHPKGTKYRAIEIKNRREQIYEQYTISYLRKIEIKISNYCHHRFDEDGKPQRRAFGDISCTVRSLSDDIPVKLKLLINPHQNGKSLKTSLADLYNGTAHWNLNPLNIVFGHFKLPIEKEAIRFNYRIEVFWSIIDIQDREHKMLPFGYVWTDPKSDWIFDPRVLYSELVG